VRRVRGRRRTHIVVPSGYLFSMAFFRVPRNKSGGLSNFTANKNQLEKLQSCIFMNPTLKNFEFTLV
jgi:hypothetical protein